MKSLLTLMHKIRPLFEQGGKAASFKPVYDAIDFFLFSPGSRTELAPFVRDPLDVKRYMSMVIIAIFPALIASVYFFGLHILAMIVVSYMAGGLVEMIFAVIRKEEINEGFLVTGMVFPLILPPALPLWAVAVGIAFGVFFGKELFGGTGRNLFNPALVGRCFLALGYPVIMSTGWIDAGTGPMGRFLQYISNSGSDAVSAATPLIQAKQGMLVDLAAMFKGNISGSAGETSAMLVVAGGLFLVFTRVANWRTVASTLGSAFLLQAVLYHINPGMYAPPLWHIFAGGILFGAFFMATDPVTSPSTNAGKWIYGIIIGSVTILIRNFTGYVEGVMFAILLGNIIAPLLDETIHRIMLKNIGYEK